MNLVSLSLHRNPTLFSFLLVKERKKLCERETVTTFLITPLDDNDACKEEGCLHIPRVVMETLKVN